MIIIPLSLKSSKATQYIESWRLIVALECNDIFFPIYGLFVCWFCENMSKNSKAIQSLFFTACILSAAKKFPKGISDLFLHLWVCLTLQMNNIKTMLNLDFEWKDLTQAYE